MKPTGSRGATRTALALVAAWGCAPMEEDAAEGASALPGVNQDGDLELDVLRQSLDPLLGSCTFVKGVVTVTSTGAQTISVNKRAVDSVILVNGEPCRSAPPVVVPADATKMKSLVIKGSAADENLILDFLGGFFAPGVSTTAAGGIAVDLGAGTDVVSIQTTASADTIVLGNDGLAFNSDRNKDITFAGVETLTVALGGGADVLTATNATPTKGVTGACRIPLRIFGGLGNDVILGGGEVDAIYGGPGNDTLSGGAGNDTLYGDDGADIMQGTAAADGDDTLNCGNEAPFNTSVDVVSYEKRVAVISAAMGTPGTAGEAGEADLIDPSCEGITGGSGNDTLTGDANDNTLSGGPGNDTLTGKGGADILNGGEGNDTFDEEASPTGGDTFNGGAGTDTLDYSARVTALAVTMDGAAADDGASGESDHVKADVENILCGSGDDSISGNTLGNVITGGAGDDVLFGGGGNDVFREGATANGSDKLAGGLGVDLVDYSARTTDLTVTMADELANDGAANEMDNVLSDVENLKAGSGHDALTGNDLANSLEGGLGNDVIGGGAGDDMLDGSDRGSAVNDIECGAGDDIAFNVGAGTYAPDCELKGL
jgi:Ca2+-binding RTX toxin-like protein